MNLGFMDLARLASTIKERRIFYSLFWKPGRVGTVSIFIRLIPVGWRCMKIILQKRRAE
jgi:hypothetical protein